MAHSIMTMFHSTHTRALSPVSHALYTYTHLSVEVWPKLSPSTLSAFSIDQ
jgi:hypothetical protein